MEKMTIDPNSLYEVPELAEYFSTSPSTVQRWIKARRMIPVPGSKKYLVLGENVLTFARGNGELIQKFVNRRAA